ncbi:MAG: hypothetical protein QM802_07175 [Agriterribacter sp.]
MDSTEKAFNFAGESSKLLITLSTGVIAFMIAFLDKDASMKPETTCEKVILIISWIIFLAAAIVGIWTQLGLTNVLEPKVKPTPFNPTIQNEKIKTPFRIQIILFAVGIMMTVIYGAIKLF